MLLAGFSRPEFLKVRPKCANGLNSYKSVRDVGLKTAALSCAWLWNMITVNTSSPSVVAHGGSKRDLRLMVS